MKSKSFLTILALSLLTITCDTDKNVPIEAYKSIEAPKAKKIEKELVLHNDSRIDNYFWMRLSDEQKNAKEPDSQTQDVLNYLKAENEYKEAALKHTEEFQNKLYDEIVGRIKKDDSSVPYNYNGYSYYTRFVEGMDYPFYCRKKLEEYSKEEIMLNGPEMAKGFEYYSIGGYEVSPDNTTLTFGVDTISRRRYTMHFKDLNTGNLLQDKLENTTGFAVWANDNKTVFYTSKNPVTLRSEKIYKHVLGTDQSQDQLVFHETDETFGTFVYKSKSEKFLMIGSYQTVSTEYQYLDADTPNGKWQVIQPRERNLEYGVSHYEDNFYIRTNLDAKNFKLVKTPVSKPRKENWIDVIPHRETVFLQSYEVFKDHLVLQERIDGLRNIRVMNWDGTNDHYIKFNDEAYLIYPTSNVEINTNLLRYSYTSLTTPRSTIDYNMDNKDQIVLKEDEILDTNFSKDNYVSERFLASSRDGVKIPISLVYNKNTKVNNKTPLLLYAYGSYGSSSEPVFRSDRLSLLDRGFIYAIAHVRGGQEMGRHWYDDGKLLNKKNTFTDFIDCADFLIDKGYTSSNNLYALGGSAGGLLMGAIVNMRPELWNGIVAAVPWVDVVTTMLDETIPLTSSEFDEWGNPKDKEYYDYLKSYSPYDNVEAKEYPSMLITTGYWDSQVQYWEPAKWIAKLRDLKTDDNLLVMDCDMDTGHGGASGRFKRYKRTALYYAFILNLENKIDTEL